MESPVIEFVALTPERLQDIIEQAVSKVTTAQAEQYLSVKEAANFLRVSECTVLNRVADKSLVCVQLGRRKLFRKSDLSNL